MTNGFEAMSTGDLILCANLLLADARSWESMTDAPELQALLKARAKDRRDLAAKLAGEADRRTAEVMSELS